MLIKTLLNQSYPLKGFIYEKIVKKGQDIFVNILPRKHSKGRCSQCFQKASGYDHLEERKFRFVPLWGYCVYLIYTPRRVSCSEHGVVVEHMPWASGKETVSQPFKLFLSHWARLLSWKEASRQFRVHWNQVFESIKYVVDYGLQHRCMDHITAIGVDEIQYLRGHKYLTLVYQIDSHCRRLLFIGKRRHTKTLFRFFYRLGKERAKSIKVVCSDLWKPYLRVIQRKVPWAIHILDRFHIMKYLNDAVDETRRHETAQMKRDGYEPLLEKSRWCLLKNKKNQTRNQMVKLRELVQYNLKTMRAYLLKEAFQRFWTYKTRAWAAKFFKEWTTQAMRSKLPEIKKVVKRLRKHQELLFNYFSVKERFSNGIVEGFNLKAKLTMRKSFGFRNFKTIEIALYHQLGKLPEPQLTHSFW